jgi:hypothetical protein
MRRHPVAVGIAVLRGQLVAVGGGERAHGAGVDQHVQAGGQAEHVGLHAAGAILVQDLDRIDLAVAAREVDLDAELALECRHQRPHHLLDDQVGVVGELTFFLGACDQLRIDVGGGRGEGGCE